MGTGKVLTEEDFEKGKEPQDTSSETIPADQKFDEEGKAIKEEPKREPEPSMKVEEEPLPEPSEDKDKKYKYASMDDYDKAYKEAERKMHEATMEKARLARELEEFKKPKDQPKTLHETIDEMTDQTLEKIKMLPADSPTRDRDSARLWARFQSEVDDVKYEERRKKEDSERNIVKKIYDHATKEGLKTDEELDYFSYRYSKTNPSFSIEERTNQAIEATKAGLGKLREGLVKDVEKDKKDKDDLKVLGRGSSRREKSEEKETQPSTMTQALAETQEKRRLKKDDIFR